MEDTRLGTHGTKVGAFPQAGANDVMLNNKDFVIESNQCN